MTFICGVIVGIVISASVAMLISDRDWKQACTEARLDMCCQNAYDYGVEVGKRIMWKECTERKHCEYIGRDI